MTFNNFCLNLQFVANGTVQPLLIAAGGGGSSDQVSSATSTEKHNARGLVNPWFSLESLFKLVSKLDPDAGKTTFISLKAVNSQPSVYNNFEPPTKQFI